MIVEHLPMPRVRVLIADDHPIVLAGVKALIDGDTSLEVIGEARDGRTALRVATELQPDIVVLDISMPGLNGVKLAEQLRVTCPKCRVLALTVHEDRGYIRQLLDIGIAGYLLKRSAPEELIRAIRAVAANGLYLDPAVASKALGRTALSLHHPTQGEVQDLSDREIEVLRLTASGHSNKSIAAELRIGVKTVETYKARAMEKLGFRTRVELVRYVISKGWLSDC